MHKLKPLFTRQTIRQAGAGLLATAVSGAAMADVPTTATEALTAAGTDATTIGWAAFGVLVTVSAFKYIRRAL